MKWFVGSQNDGLCVIDQKPSPAGTDVVWEGRKDVKHIACVDLLTLPFVEAQRYANIIAAAPEMLDALQHCVEALRAIASARGLVADHGDALDEALNAIRKAQRGS